MKTILHILLKDLRKFWPVILATVVVRIFGYGLALANLDAMRGLSGLGPVLPKVLQQAPLAQWAMVFLLSVWVVLEDRAVGDRIGWLTRPIFARDLLAAKFCFLVLAVAVPAGLVGAGVAVWLNAPLPTVLAMGTSSLLFTLFAAAIFATIAVVCGSLNQALLLTAGLFCGVALGSYALFELAQVKLPLAPTGISGRSTFIVAVGMTSISAIATLGHQYGTLRSLRTVVLAVLLSLVTFAAVRWWPLSFWPDSRVLAVASPTPADKLKLISGSGPADFRTREPDFGEQRASVLVPLRLDGILPDRSFEVRAVDSTLAMDTGVTISTVNRYGAVIEDELAAAAALGFATPAHAPSQYITVVDCALDQFRQLQGQSGKLTARFSLNEMHYEAVARLPVRAGAEIKSDGQLSRIFSTQFINGSCDIGFQFAHIVPVLGTRRPAWPNHTVLVNAKRGEYSDSHGGNMSGTGGPEMAFITSHNRFAETRSQQNSKIVGKVDAAWLADAELYFLVGDEVEGGPVSLSFTMDKLTVPTTQVTRHVIVINPDGTRDEYDR